MEEASDDLDKRKEAKKVPLKAIDERKLTAGHLVVDMGLKTRGRCGIPDVTNTELNHAITKKLRVLK